MLNSLLSVLTHRWILVSLLLINTVGTAYGYMWYLPQLKETPSLYLVFVPDSPTASLFFVIVLIAYLLKRSWPIFEALAFVTLVKYGIWAVAMNLLVLNVTGDLPWQGYMLIASHGAMAVQGVLYSGTYSIKLRHLMIAAVWTLHNDVIDYLFGMMPPYILLNQYMMIIGYYTFWLSVISITIVYMCSVRRNHTAKELTQR